MNPILGLVVLASLSAAFTTGVFLGRTIAAQRQVDRMLRRELRFRASVTPRHTARHAVYVADGSKLGLTTEEAMFGSAAFSEALRARHRRSPMDQPPEHGGGEQ